jgi:DNA-binding HxlR family transcriptional regulator
MYTVKETSTNQLNKSVATEICPVSYTLSKIGGRWKPLIIYQLNNGPMRYGVLKKTLPNITEKMLIQNLRELEMDNLITREVKPVVPPNVTYALSEKGDALKPLFESMANWGKTYWRDQTSQIQNQSIPSSAKL